MRVSCTAENEDLFEDDLTDQHALCSESAPLHKTSAVFYTLWTMANAQTVLHKLKDVQRCADILRERLPRDSAHHERARDVGEVFGEYARDLQPQLQGASTMTTKQRNLIKKIARKADITYRLLRSLVGTKNLTYLQF